MEFRFEGVISLNKFNLPYRIIIPVEGLLGLTKKFDEKLKKWPLRDSKFL